jgi:hypothetical protein
MEPALQFDETQRIDEEDTSRTLNICRVSNEGIQMMRIALS